MKQWFRKQMFFVLRYLGIPWLWRRMSQNDRVTVLCYHDPRPEIFDAHLRALGRNYAFLPLRDFVNALISGKSAALPRYGLVITLDDGHAGNMALLEVIKRHRVPVTIFLTSGIVGTRRRFWWTSVKSPMERYHLKQMPDAQRVRHLDESGFRQEIDAEERQALNRAEIVSMAPSVDFQAHTRFHPILPKCAMPRAWEEINGSREDLIHSFGFDIYAIAYPNGDYSEREIELTARAGFACALTMDDGANGVDADPYRIRRIGIPDDASVDEMIVKASGLWAWLKAVRQRQKRRRGYQPTTVSS